MRQHENQSPQRDPVNAYCKVCIDEIDDLWRATFDGRSDPVGTGADPEEAIRHLFGHEPSGRLVIVGVIALDDATRDGHREFIVTMTERRWNSVPIQELSLNS